MSLNHRTLVDICNSLSRNPEHYCALTFGWMLRKGILSHLKKVLYAILVALLQKLFYRARMTLNGRYMRGQIGIPYSGSPIMSA